MKTKHVINSGFAATLAVPQYGLAGTGMVLGGVEAVIRTAADGVGFLKTKAFNGERYFETTRANIAAEMAEYEAAAAAVATPRHKAGRKPAMA